MDNIGGHEERQNGRGIRQRHAAHAQYKNNIKLQYDVQIRLLEYGRLKNELTFDCATVFNYMNTKCRRAATQY